MSRHSEGAMLYVRMFAISRYFVDREELARMLLIIA